MRDIAFFIIAVIVLSAASYGGTYDLTIYQGSGFGIDDNPSEYESTVITVNEIIIYSLINPCTFTQWGAKMTQTRGSEQTEFSMKVGDVREYQVYDPNGIEVPGKTISINLVQVYGDPDYIACTISEPRGDFKIGAPAYSYCEDSDNGVDIYAAGSAYEISMDSSLELGNYIEYYETGRTKYSDLCISESTVSEFYCDNNQVSTKRVSCPDGYYCENGACVAITEDFCEDSDGRDQYTHGVVTEGVRTTTGEVVSSEEYEDECHDIKTVKEYVCSGVIADYEYMTCSNDYVCKQGRCVLDYDEFCEDEDGRDIYVKGTATYGFEDNGRIVSSDEYEDYCKNSNTVKEYYCEGISIKSKLYECPYGYVCSGGRCVSETYEECADTDGGDDKYVKGIVTYSLYEDGQLISQESHVDMCNGSFAVVEYYCSNNKVKEAMMDCPKGYACDNGVCAERKLQKGIATVIYMQEGWNSFSIPLEYDDIQTNCDGLLEKDSSGNLKNVWMYSLLSGSYKHPKEMKAGYGYWYKSERECFISLVGDEYALSGKSLSAGWNFIGAGYESAQFSEIAEECEVIDGPWVWNSENETYEESSALEKGRGYFVKLKSSCTLR